MGASDCKEDEAQRMCELVCAFTSEAAVWEIRRWGPLTRRPLMFSHLDQVALWSGGIRALCGLQPLSSSHRERRELLGSLGSIL